MKEKSSPKKYLIALEESRSVTALAAGVLIFFIALAAVFVKALRYDGTQEFPLHYFTVLSNLLTAVSAAIMVPYAADTYAIPLHELTNAYVKGALDAMKEREHP